MEALPGLHQIMCKGCQKVPLQYRCLRWSPNNDPRFVSWNCEGCLPSRGTEYCYDCGISRTMSIASMVTPPVQFSSTSAFATDIVSRTECSNCRINRIPCSRLHTAASKCEACLEHNLECDCEVIRKTCHYCTRRKLRCAGNEDSCIYCIKFLQECKPYEPEKALSSESCLGCEDSPTLTCDRNPDGCVHCRLRKQPCMYPSPNGEIFSKINNSMS